MRYGTAVKSAPLSRKVTRRFPESIKVPRVGQSGAATDATGGAYESVSSPASLKTPSKAEGGNLSEFTISSDTTVQPSIIIKDAKVHFTYHH